LSTHWQWISRPGTCSSSSITASTSSRPLRRSRPPSCARHRTSGSSRRAASRSTCPARSAGEFHLCRCRAGRQTPAEPAPRPWRYDLLEPEERTLFIRLSAFAGSFDLAAVESVCSGNGIESTQVIGLLPKLVDKSLVSAVRMGGGTRYRLLETLRDYARVRLAT